MKKEASKYLKMSAADRNRLDKKICRLYAKGKTYKEIMAACDCTVNIVSAAIRKARNSIDSASSVEPRKLTWTPEMDAKLTALVHQDGDGSDLTIKEIAALMDLEPSSVYNRLQYLEIDHVAKRKERLMKRCFEMFDSGQVRGEIAYALDISKSTVNKWIADRNRDQAKSGGQDEQA